MSVIYETKKDVERHNLSAQANSLRQRSLIEAAGQVALIAGSWVAKGLHDKNPIDRNWLKHLGTGMVLSGLVLMAKSLITAHQAHSLDRQREQLGPENTILLNEATNCECPVEVQSTYAKKFQPKTPLDHAIHTIRKDFDRIK